MEPITNREIAIVCPTKDRPEKISRLLSSLEQQTELPGQIIISDAGSGNEHIAETYSGRLNILHLDSPLKGQVNQRKYAMTHLEKNIRVVVCLDDDVTFEPDTMTGFRKAWNKHQNAGGLPLGGLGLNVMDAVKPRKSILRKLMLMSSDTPGSVSLSGYSTSYAPTSEDVQTSFLLGGSTGWCRSVIDNHPHPIDFPTRWAVCEDIIFSYGVGKTRRLVVTSQAHLNHNETYADLSFARAIFYGKSQVTMRHYLVSLYDDLSRPAFFWMSLAQNFGYFLIGITGRIRFSGMSIGGMTALFRCFRTVFGYKSAKQLAVELYHE